MKRKQKKSFNSLYSTKSSLNKKMLFISLLLLVLSIFFIKKGKKSAVFLSLFSLILFLGTSAYIVADYFTGEGLNQAFLYHLRYGIEGGSIKGDMFIVITGCLLSLLSIVSTIFIYKYLKNKPDTDSKWEINKLAILLLILSFYIHPLTQNILELNGFKSLSNTSFDTENTNASGLAEESFSDLYRLPELKDYDIDTKNIVFIYLESYENLYLDEELFPGLADNLLNLKNNSIYFDNITEAYGTSWTIAGMVGSQCGIPLINSGGGGNSMHGINSFLPKALCLGDILAKAGYDLNYIGGSDIDFAGKGNFYKTHGFNSVEGKNQLVSRLYDSDYQYDWGLYDDSVFDLAYRKYEKLSEKDEKFGLFMINMDTHGSEGSVSSSCKNYSYTDSSENSILNSYNCSDKLLGSFIDKIKNSKNFKDTIIVIASDHYAMNHNNSIDIIKQKEQDRKMLFLIIDYENTKEIVNKKGSTLDLGATVLSKIGFSVDYLGLGVNLFSDELSIAEKGNFVFNKYKKAYESFWEYPSFLKNGLEFDESGKKVIIDSQNIRIPALFYLDDNFEIEKILWEDSGGPISISEEIPKNKKSIYIDSCENIDSSKTGFCVKYTNKNGDFRVDNLLDKENIYLDEIIEMF